MLSRLMHWSLQFRFLVLLGSAAVAYFGVTQMRSHEPDILPEFAPLAVEVQAEALGLAPAEVESLVTAPLEEILSGVPWLKSMQSKSIAGLSAVTLLFEDGANLFRARQMVQERLLHTSVLPKVTKPPAMLQPTSDLNRAMQIGLTSSKLSLTEVSLLARWKIKPRLMSVPGVANVTIFGQRERQLQVEVDTEKLNAKGVQLKDVIQAAGNALWVSPLTYLRASTPGNGGFIDTPTQRYDIRHVLPISSPEDLSRVAFQAADGSTLRLSDVAKVVEGHQPLIGDGIVNDAPGLMLVVEKLPGANTLEVTRGVERALEVLEPGLPGVDVRTSIYRPATFIQSALSNLSTWFVLGGVLLALALFAMLRDARAAVVCLVSIALSLLASWLALLLLGHTMNAMVMTGIAIALVLMVDDAIVDVDHFRQKRHADGADATLASVILRAAAQIRTPMLYTVGIAALLVWPIVFVHGAASALLMPLVEALLVALLASTLVAHMTTPALVLVLYRSSRHDMGGVSGSPGWLHGRCAGVLKSATDSPTTVLAIVAVVIVLGLGVVAFGPKDMVPAINDRDLVVEWEMKSGASYPLMSALVGEASKKVRAIPGIREVGAHIGRAIQSDRISGINKAEIWVGLNPDANYEATITAVKNALQDYPGLHGEPLPYATVKIRKALEAQDDTVAVRVFGPRWDMLQTKAEEVRKALGGVQGITNPRIDARMESTNIKIEVDLAKAERFGVKPGDIRRGVSTLLAGIEVGSLYEEQKIFEVIVWGSKEARHDKDGLQNLVIDTPSGARVRLGDVAEVKEVQSPTEISRFRASRYVDVVADLNGEDMAIVAANIKASLASVTLPLEFHTELVGASASGVWVGTSTDHAWVTAAAIAAVLGMLLLLQTLLGSWALAVIAFLVGVAALASGALAAIASGSPLSLGSVAGLCAVLLLATRQSVLLLMTAQQLPQKGQSPSQVMEEAVGMRIAPVLAATVCVLGLFLPVIFMGKVSGFEILHPMACVLVGGAIASALLSLFALPCLLKTFYDGRSMAHPDASMHIATEQGV